MIRKALAVAVTSTALIISSAAYAAFAPAQIDYNFESKIVKSGSGEDQYNRLDFTVPGVQLPTSFYCGMVTATWTGSQPVARNKINAGNKGLSVDGTKCSIIMPKDMKPGSYEINLSYSGNSQVYRFHYTDNEPIETHFYQQQTAIESPDYMAGEFVYLTFFKYYARLGVENIGNLPEGLTVWSSSTSDSLIISGRINTTEPMSYRLNVVDLDGDKEQAVTLNIKPQPKAPDPDPEPNDDDEPTTKPKTTTFMFRFAGGGVK